MISALDIRERAGEWGLSPDVVEKDYVLGWLLAGIGGDPVLGESRRSSIRFDTSYRRCMLPKWLSIVRSAPPTTPRSAAISFALVAPGGEGATPKRPL